MTYAYYQRLSARDKKIYRQSDRTSRVVLNAPTQLQGDVNLIQKALTDVNVTALEYASEDLLNHMANQLRTVGVRVHVMDQRPSDEAGELHGLYEPVTEFRMQGRIMVWMRTARRGQVVAFKAFLRTLLHEFCHHLDYEYFQLEDSFHTRGFFQREASLYRQLAGHAERT